MVTKSDLQVKPFPRAAIVGSLRQELIQAVVDEASIKGTPLPSTPEDIVNAEVEIDSLVVVSLLCTIESHLNFELSESVVRTGGYRSIEAALKHLLPRIENEWKKQNGVAS